MNGAQVHLLVNHLPVLVPLIGALLIALGLVFRSFETRKTGAWLLVFGALSTIPVYLTGEPAETVLKNYPGYSHILVDDHEKAALYTLIWMLVTGTGALGLLCAFRLGWKAAHRSWTWSVLLLLSLFSFTVAARTAHLGGLIRHEEIRATDRF